ncbi:MAG: hypothetical protein ABIR66_02725 [Saprospiraceae bacterium]
MNTSVYDLRGTNHADELIHYLTNLVIPKAIKRHSLGKLKTQDRSERFNETNFPFDAIDHNGKDKSQELYPVQFFS